MGKSANEISIHSGHRKRLREKVKNAGLNSLSEHEIVELLLTYAIPRQNTNPLAHDLINNFGSLSKVIDADYYDLLKVKGLGEESALFINIISSLIQEYRKSKANEENIIIRNTIDGINYFRKIHTVGGKEILHIICMSKLGKIVSSFNFAGNSDVEINFDFKMFIDKINRDNVNSIMMFHTHPAGQPDPSMSDLQTTQRCVYICYMLGIDFLDHLILTENGFCSMYQRGYIEKMKANSLNLVISPLDVESNIQNLFNKNLNLDNLDLGDISIEEKLKKRK